MFRRPRFRPPGRQIRTEPPPLLRRAIALMESGAFLEAAPIFEQLAAGARARNLPQASRLLLQAGWCWVKAQRVEQGKADLRAGLIHLRESGNRFRFEQITQRVIRDLSDLGLENEAAEIQAILGERNNENSIEKPGAEPSKGILPTRCDSCGGSLRSDEIEWIDDLTAECPYCGSAIRTT